MNKRLFFIVSFLLFFFYHPVIAQTLPRKLPIKQQQGVVTGKISDCTDGIAILSIQNADSWTIDTIKITNGQFVYKYFLDEPKYTLLKIKRSGDSKNIFFKTGFFTPDNSPYATWGFILDNKEAVISVTLADTVVNKYRSYGAIKGSSESGLYYKLSYDRAFGHKYTDSIRANIINYDLIKQNSKSLWLMKDIYQNKECYTSIDTLKMIYNLFDKSVQASKKGKQFKDYCDRLQKFARFDNIRLPECKSGKSEPIIVDSAKYNLVVFSASWCGYCHQLIPLLKEMYMDLKSQLDIVYISIDEKETVEGWKKLMEKKEIPWRSLLAVNNVEAIKNKYFISGIPDSYLIYPNGKFEKFDVRNASNKAKLYKLLQD